MKQLNPKAVWLFFIQDLFAFAFLLFFIFIMFGFSFIAIFLEGTGFLDSLSTGIVLFLIFLMVLFVVSFIWAKLRYKFYKYELREDGFRKESGVILKKYVTIPYERIQNVDIYRGLFARMLGLSDLQIQTAGSSISTGRFGGGGAEGRLPGVSVEDAESIRDELVRRSKGQQLSQSQPNQPQAPNPQSQQGL